MDDLSDNTAGAELKELKCIYICIETVCAKILAPNKNSNIYCNDIVVVLVCTISMLEDVNKDILYSKMYVCLMKHFSLRRSRKALSIHTMMMKLYKIPNPNLK